MFSSLWNSSRADIGLPRLVLECYLPSYFLSRLRVLHLRYPISQVSVLVSEFSE